MPVPVTLEVSRSRVSGSEYLETVPISLSSVWGGMSGSPVFWVYPMRRTRKLARHQSLSLVPYSDWFRLHDIIPRTDYKTGEET